LRARRLAGLWCGAASIGVERAPRGARVARGRRLTVRRHLLGYEMCRKLEGGVSAVTKQITVKDKYQKQLAELDLMAEDWVDTDEVPLSPSPPPFLSHT
jgi:hypothetical protein